MRTISLPLCPTDNRRLIPIRIGRSVRLVSSPRYRQWQKEAAQADLTQIVYLEPSYENQLSIKYKLYLPNKRSDIGNYSKALCDFLKGKAFKDDRWVKMDLQLPVEIDKVNPRIELIF